MRGLATRFILVAGLAVGSCLAPQTLHAQRAAKPTTNSSLPPLPPPRPKDIPGDSSTPPDASAASVVDSACLKTLEQRGVVFTPVQGQANEGACAVDEPVSFRSVTMDGGRTISLDAPVTVRCALAAELALWVRNDMAPAVERHGMTLSGLSGVGGHECRGRNRQTGGLISEHARGNAFDLRRLVVDGDRKLELMASPSQETRAFREDVKRSACARFPTVLGSGADGFHEDHLHVDLRERRGGYRLCQWDVR